MIDHDRRITRAYEDGVLRQWWDDATRTYHEYDAAGVETTSRPYGAEENTEADQRASDQALAVNEATLSQQLREQVAALTASLDTIKATRAVKKATIGESTDTTNATLRGLLSMSNTTITNGANVKALVRLIIDGVQADRDTDRALIDAQRAVIRISRLVARNLDSADSGTPDAQA